MDKEEASMMKNWKKIVLLLVILAALATAFILLNNKQKELEGSEGNTSSDNGKELLIGLKSEDIVKILLKRGDNNIELILEESTVKKEKAKEDGTTGTIEEKEKVWTTPAFNLDSSKADAIARAAEYACINRLIDENPSDLSVYGLSNPSATTFITADGAQVSIEIGDQTPLGDYYVRKSESPAVYTLNPNHSEILLYDKFDLMNINIYGSEEIRAEDITYLSFYRDQDLIFEAEQDDVPEPSVYTWTVIKPFEIKTSTKGVSEFLHYLASMRVSEFVEDNTSNLNQYGLDNPKYEFNYIMQGESYKLKIGIKKDNKYYASMEGNPVIFTLYAPGLNFVDTPLIDVVDTYAYLPNIIDVEKLVIEMDGRVDEILLDVGSGDPSNDKYFFNGSKIEGEENIKLIKDYYTGAVSVHGDKIDLEARPLKTADIRLTYTMKKNSPDKVVTVELVPTKDGYGYYLMRDGSYTGFIMAKRQLEDAYMGIRTAYKKLKEELKP
jgi:hypothetical protein